MKKFLLFFLIFSLIFSSCTIKEISQEEKDLEEYNRLVEIWNHTSSFVEGFQIQFDQYTTFFNFTLMGKVNDDEGKTLTYNDMEELERLRDMVANYEFPSPLGQEDKEILTLYFDWQKKHVEGANLIIDLIRFYLEEDYDEEREKALFQQIDKYREESFSTADQIIASIQALDRKIVDLWKKLDASQEGKALLEGAKTRDTIKEENGLTIEEKNQGDLP